MRPWWGGGRADRGSGTVLAVGVAAALVVTAVGGLALAAAVLATHRARSAADLAALAGARAWVDGSSQAVACGRAGQLATANGATVARCVVEADTLLVEVRAPVRSRLPLVAGRSATAVARAGPAPPRLSSLPP